MKTLATVFVVMALGYSTTNAAGPPTLEFVSSEKLWDQAPHCAFTDLTYWKDQFVCAFREGRAHVSTDGCIRVLTSKDGNSWSSAAVLTLAGYDLRDAGLAIAPGNRLMLIGGAAPRKNDHEHAPTGSFVAFSDDGKTWTEPKIVVEPGYWLWRVTWHEGKAYGIAYPSVRPKDADQSTRLLVSDDGLKCEPLVSKLNGDGVPTEATLRFAKDGTMYCLQRRDGEPRPKSALLGSSKAPYTDWQWHDLGQHVGGPNFIQLPTGQWIAAGRFFDTGDARTKVAWLDVENNTIQPLVELPSGGDCSYPGLVWHNNLLWVSYYSSHEGKTNIYLAKLRVK